MIDYTIFYKERHSPDAFRARAFHWDVLIAAYDGGSRATATEHDCSATTRLRVAPAEFEYTGTVPDDVVRMDPNDPLTALLDALSPIASESSSICLDISSFVPHHVLMIVRVLDRLAIRKFEVVYTEPIQYISKEQTRFSDENVLSVEPVAGYAGTHDPDIQHDLLVIATGYDHRLLLEVANEKEHAKKVQIFGLPSLRPDMYQEAILRSRKAAEGIGTDASSPSNYRFAPANDPFATASVVADIVRAHHTAYPNANVYLAPLSTKAQALGMGIFYLSECVERATSIIFPMCDRHERETTKGVSGVWHYVVELPARPSDAEL